MIKGIKNPTIFNVIRWVDRLIDQASDGTTKYYFDRLKIKQWVAGLDLGYSKLFIIFFCKVTKNELEEFLQNNLQEIMKKTLLGTATQSILLKIV